MDADNAAQAFLDSFPKEVLPNVLRYFSAIPNAKKWEMHIESGDLVELFGVRGGLGVLLKSCFTTLCVSDRTNHCYNEHKYWVWKVRTEPHLWTNNITVANAFVQAGGGETLKTLVVGCVMYDKKRDGQDLVYDLLRNFPNLKSFSIDDRDSPQVINIGGKLEKLELIYNSSLDNYLDCTAVRQLCLSAARDLYSSLDVWQRIGHSLEKLVIYDIYQVKNALKLIGEHCLILKSISLTWWDNGETSAIVDLLVLLGNRLEYAELYHSTDAQLTVVAVTCPNACYNLIRVLSSYFFQSQV